MTGVRERDREKEKEAEREGESAAAKQRFKEKSKDITDVRENYIKRWRWMAMTGVNTDKEVIKNTGGEVGRDSSGD